MVDVFVCSKPLQYLNLKNIPLEYSSQRKKMLIIVNAFYGSHSFYKYVKETDKTWYRVVFASSDSRALVYIMFLNISRLFINYDISIQLAILYKIKNMEIYTYEEGVGSYYSVKKWNSGALACVRKLLGVGQVNNSSHYLTACFLYRPDIFYKIRPESTLIVKRMCNPFLKSLENNMEFWFRYYDFKKSGLSDIRNKKILIYITSWEISEKILFEIRKREKEFDKIIIKPHPHIKEIEYTLSKAYTVLRTPIMVEMILLYLRNNNNSICVFHESSTSMVYFEKEIESVNFNIHDSYNEFVSYI